MGSSAARSRAGLAARLYGRRGEIERAVLTRIYALAAPEEVSDPEYVDGLKAAVAAALDYGLAGIGEGEVDRAQVPATLLVQARLAARNRVELATVLRRYFAGYALLSDFVVGEVEAAGCDGLRLQRLLQSQARLFDQLLVAVAQEHRHESERQAPARERRQARLVSRLLAGEALEGTELGFDLEGASVGLVASGPRLRETLSALAAALDRTLLLVPRGEEAAWAWLGGRRALPTELIAERANTLPAGVRVALGEPGLGLAGWRLTHRQAQAAFVIARRKGEAVVRYADVGLIASIIQDEVLAASLRQLYVDPLAAVAGGENLRETLCAYLAADRNASSAAAALSVDRRTVTRRIQIIEGTLGRSLREITAEVEAALRLWDIDESPLGVAVADTEGAGPHNVAPPGAR